MMEPGAATGPATDVSPDERARTLWFRAVLAGLVVLILGFTAILIRNSYFPCVPAEGSLLQPPLADCAVALSPWIGLAAAGLVLAGLGFLRIR